MPNGRPYESPLNKLADALPNVIMQMQDMKMRQEAQEALTNYRMTMLNRQIATETAERETKEALEQVRRDIGYYEPPEAKLMRDSISSQYRTLNDPDVALTLGDEEITKRWKKLQGDQADYYGKYGRRIDLSIPIPVEGALGRVEVAKKPTVIDAAIVAPADRGKRVFPPAKLGETEAGYRRRIDPAAQSVLAGQKKVLGLPAGGELAGAPAVTIPEGARAVETKEAGWVYTLDEKVWISVETGEPITGQ